MKRITPSNAIPRMIEAGWIVTVKREDGDLWASATRSVAAPTDYETVIVELAKIVLAGREVR